MRSFYAVRIDADGNATHHKSAIIDKDENRPYELWQLGEAFFSAIEDPEDRVYIEEPPLAGSRNLRVFLHLSQSSGVLASYGTDYTNFVEVSKWKKHVVGRGNATKPDVAKWLEKNHKNLFDQCGGDQNFVDATCIALYGHLDIR